MSVKMRQIVECRIAKALVREGLAAGYNITVDNGDNGEDECEIELSTNYKDIIAAMFQTDDELLIFRKGDEDGWVRLVYGNDGWDVISDYSVNLEHIMGRANEISRFYEE